MKDMLNDPIKGYEFTRQIECIEHEHAMKNACMQQIYVSHLKEEPTRLRRDKPTACVCSVGYRGGLGASILKKIGFKEVHNVLGGMRAWKALGYPVEKK